VRIDAGIVEGDSISPYYDPMVAKVIAHGQDRNEAIRRLMVALEDTPLLGINNNGRFLRDLVHHESFRAARMHTALLDEWSASGQPPLQRPQPTEEDWLLAAALFGGSAGWRSLSVSAHSLTLSCMEQHRTVRVEAGATGVKVGAGDTATNIAIAPETEGILRYTIDGLTRRATVHRSALALHISRDSCVFVFTEVSPFPASADSNDPRLARAAVAGTVARISVADGERVSAGQTLLVIEAMKMEMRVTAAANGTVARIHAAIGEQVAAGSVLVELTIEETT
jgi:geranyl-CoA carboxylase alpha subunit